MKSALLFAAAVNLLASSASFAVAPSCPDFPVEGKWMNGWGLVFQVDQPSCNEVVIQEIDQTKSKPAYKIKFDGKTKAVIIGDEIANVPTLVQYDSTQNNGWENRKKTPFVEQVQMTGRRVTNPYAGNNNNPQSRNIIELSLTASFAIPLDKQAKSFYQIAAGAKATIGIYGTGKDEELYISIRDAKIISAGKGAPTPFSKGLIAGINGLLSLQNSDFIQDGNITSYVSGPRIFVNMIDHGSRKLKRVP